MESRKRSSSSTIEINGALGKRASRSHAQPPLYGRVKRCRASMRIRMLYNEGRCSKRGAAKPWFRPDRGQASLRLRETMVKSAAVTLAESAKADF